LQAKKGVAAMVVDDARAKKGRGSWSGKNCQVMGCSDDEIVEQSLGRKEMAVVNGRRELG